MHRTDPGRRRWVARAALVLAALTTAAVLPDGAGAANPHRAVVVVETGADTHRVVVTFTEDSISGIEALRRAGAGPVVYSFSGQGGAVCRLFGVGRDASSNCLGGQDGDNRYWAYFRAPAGTSTFEYSRVGAGSVQVRDGDVEGWRFGTGQAPQYVSLQALAPPPPSPTNAPPSPAAGANPGATSAPAARGATGPAAAAPGAPASVSTLPATGDAPASTAAAKDGDERDGSTAADGGRSGERDERRAAATETALASSKEDEASDSALSLLWLALLLVAIGAAIVVVRRVRRRGATSP
jgi:hypothetical protein